MNKISFRPKREEDHEGMVEVACALSQWFTPEGLADMAQDFKFHAGFIAMDEGKIVGFITYETLTGNLAELSWIGVHPGYQHQGVGKRLLQLLEEQLITQGIRILQVSTLADSVVYEPYAETRAFYRANGFQDYRIDPGYYHGDDRLLLRKYL
jgi:ribosomal protein S18 acetylase RimI-like enzyme